MSDKRWSKERPLRVVTAYMNLAEQFFIDQGFEHVAGMGEGGGGGEKGAKGSILCYSFTHLVLSCLHTLVNERPNSSVVCVALFPRLSSRVETKHEVLLFMLRYLTSSPPHGVEKRAYRRLVSE